MRRLARIGHALIASSTLAWLALGCGDDGAPPPVDIGDFDAGGMDAGPDAMRPPIPDSGRLDSGPIDSGHDTGPIDQPDVRVPPTPDEDAGSCEDDCGAMTTECAIGVCNLETLECELVAAADGTECGEQATTACSAKDTCEAGVCQPHHAEEGTACGDQGDACRRDDECNDQGVCIDSGLRPVGTLCGDQTETECDAPNSCDATGECVENFAPVDTACGDQNVPCRDNDTCNGSGACIDQGRWEKDFCPNGVPVNPVDGRCICGDPEAPTTTDCRAGPAVCDDAGACIPGNVFYGGAENGDPCNRDDGENGALDDACTNPDTCLDGECVPNNEDLGFACGDRVTNTVCDGLDSCDGFGQCDDHLADVTTVCDDAPGPCFNEPLCNGSGQCLEASGALPGTMCGPQTSTDCDGPDVCDGFGGCDEGFAPPETECGPAPSSVCDAIDQCNGSGTCVPHFADTETACADETECSNARTCDGSGDCAPDPKPAGEPCTGSFTECQDGSECDGDGTCAPNYALEGTECGDPALTCEIQDSCDDAGACIDRGNMPGCGIATTITLELEAEGADDEPVAGAQVEVLDSEPLESGVTDVNGQVVLTLPAGQRVLLRIYPTATTWGRVEAVQVSPAESELGFGVSEDAFFASMVDAAGVAAVDTSRGAVHVRFYDVSNTGGERAALLPACAEATCGPVVLEDFVDPVLSDELLPDSDQMYYLSLQAGSYSVTPAGESGVNTCALASGSNPWPVFEHTITGVLVQCTPE